MRGIGNSSSVLEPTAPAKPAASLSAGVHNPGALLPDGDLERLPRSSGAAVQRPRTAYVPGTGALSNAANSRVPPASGGLEIKEIQRHSPDADGAVQRGMHVESQAGPLAFVSSGGVRRATNGNTVSFFMRETPGNWFPADWEALKKTRQVQAMAGGALGAAG